MDISNLPRNLADDYPPTRPNLFLSLLAAVALLCGVGAIIAHSTFGLL
jgi:hypothetical protein